MIFCLHIHLHSVIFFHFLSMFFQHSMFFCQYTMMISDEHRLHYRCSACLRSWLEQETSCPICRASLGEPAGGVIPMNGMMGNPEGIPIPPLPGMGANPAPPRIIRRPLNTTNHFFHFDGNLLSIFYR